MVEHPHKNGGFFTGRVGFSWGTVHSCHLFLYFKEKLSSPTLYQRILLANLCKNCGMSSVLFGLII